MMSDDGYNYGGDGGDFGYDDYEPEDELEVEEEFPEGENDGAEEQENAMVPQSEAQDPKRVPDDKRTMPPFMTKFERVRILALRATQIAERTPVFVSPEADSDPLKLALKELEQGLLPFVIRRHHPDGCYEDWKVRELVPYTNGWPVPTRHDNL